MICSDIWHKYHEWYFEIVIRNLRQFWNITSGIYAKYHVQIMLLFVYTTTCKRFVIFTCRYFKLSWNTAALGQSNCRNFSCSSINTGIYWDKLKLQPLFNRWSTWPTHDQVAFRSVRNDFNFFIYLNLFINLLKTRGKTRISRRETLRNMGEDQYQTQPTNGVILYGQGGSASNMRL